MENRFIELDESFNKFEDALEQHFTKVMCPSANEKLFRVNIEKDKIRELYLTSFEEGTNPIFRKRRFFECSACLHFIGSFGGVVSIDKTTYEITTMWDFECGIDYFDKVAKALAKYVRECALATKISDVFLTSYDMGIKSSIEHDESGSTVSWRHLWVPKPESVHCASKDIGTKLNDYASTKVVLANSLNEISVDACETVLELISSDSLYKGLDYKKMVFDFLKVLKDFIAFKEAVNSSNVDEKKKTLLIDCWLWKNSVDMNSRVAHIKNTSIGILLTDITKDVELDEAVTKYEQVVAPENYKRPKAIYTAKMLEKARQQIEALGYLESLPRRFATLDDIRINNVLFSNRDVAKKVFGVGEGAAMFDDMKKTVSTINPRSFSRCDIISIKDFLANVVPTIRKIDLLFESRLQKNLVSLIAPKNPEAKPMFIWNNGFSWSYKGNIADSSLKKNVAKAGGDVTGDLRFSIQWNDTEEYDGNDLDAHCITPGTHIYFRNKVDYESRGNLDIDIINPVLNEPAVENITFPTRSEMPDGVYTFCTHCFTFRGGRGGFRAQIEFDNQVFNYDYSQAMRQDEIVKVAEVTKTGDTFTIKHFISTDLKSQTIWGINTNQFVPVSVIMHSPNYWEGEEGKGPKHTFFMIEGCVNNERPNGFFNEYLNADFKDYKRVMEALGAKAAVEDKEPQLSGIGVSYTQHAYVYLKVYGNIERVLKVTF